MHTNYLSSKFKKFCLMIFLTGNIIIMNMTGCSKENTEILSEEEFLEENTEEEVSVEKEESEIYVDVCGAVKNPGVVVLDSGSRIYQAIEAAGGFLPEAAKRAINQAQCLNDGEQIYIPSEDEMTEQKLEIADSEKEATKVDLNTADESQLTTLPGIGEAKAKAIISYREENGKFTSIEDIMQVQGIKESLFMKIQDDIVVR